MKKMKRNRIRFIIVLAIPLLILMSLTVKPLWALTSGEDILLLTVPVDPRDLFYGDYVTLRYEIEEVPSEKVSVHLLKELERHSSFGKVKVYGKLIQEENVFIVEELTIKKPSDGLYLSGHMNRYQYFNEDGVKIYNVNFGLDRFYVPENTGAELEDLSRKGELVAHVKVKNGYALLRDIGEAK